jgi:hypothetical protein
MKEAPLRILVTGGLYYRDRTEVFDTLDEIHAEQGIGVIIHDAAQALKGAGWLAEEWADLRGVGVERYPVARRMDGPWPQAHVNRNTRMLDEAKPDGVVSFPGEMPHDDAATQAALAGLVVWWVAGRQYA